MQQRLSHLYVLFRVFAFITLILFADCLQPPLRVVPQGDWYCASCAAERAAAEEAQRVAHRSSRAGRSRRQTTVESESESNVVCHVCGVDKDDNKVILCDGDCDHGFHLCVFNLRCASSSLNQHADCLSPPLTSVPRGDWYCDECAQEDDDYASDASDSVVCVRCKSGDDAEQLVLCDGDCGNATHLYWYCFVRVAIYS